jgi:hypothetical protein
MLYLLKLSNKRINNDDCENVLHFLLDILVNEFGINLDFDNLDSNTVNF